MKITVLGRGTVTITKLSDYTVVRSKRNNNHSYLSNWYHETITEKEYNDILGRIMKLPEDKIDELWFRVGYIHSNKGENKAIKPSDVKRIKESEDAARSFFVPLFEETHIYRIKTFLDEVEIECGIQKASFR